MPGICIPQFAGGELEWSLVGTLSLQASDVAISPDGKTALAVGTTGCYSLSWNGNSWVSPVLVSGTAFTGVAISPDGKTALAVGATGCYSLSWNGNSWGAPTLISGTALLKVAISPDGLWALAANGALAYSLTWNGSSWTFPSTGSTIPNGSAARPATSCGFNRHSDVAIITRVSFRTVWLRKVNTSWTAPAQNTAYPVAGTSISLSQESDSGIIGANGGLYAITATTQAQTGAATEITNPIASVRLLPTNDEAGLCLFLSGELYAISVVGGAWELGGKVDGVAVSGITVRTDNNIAISPDGNTGLVAAAGNPIYVIQRQ